MTPYRDVTVAEGLLVQMMNKEDITFVRVFQDLKTDPPTYKGQQEGQTFPKDRFDWNEPFLTMSYCPEWGFSLAHATLSIAETLTVSKLLSQLWPLVKTFRGEG